MTNASEPAGVPATPPVPPPVSPPAPHAAAGTADGGSRRDFLEHAARILWPPPAEIELRCGRRRRDRQAPPAGRTQEYLVVPNVEDARLVLPADAARAAGRIAGGGPASASAGTRLRSRALAAVLAGGVAGLAFPDRLLVHLPEGAATIESHLSDALGTPVVVGLSVTRPRANRKPMLQVLTPAGRPVAYVKVGSSPLTAALVANEARVLRTLASASRHGWTIPSVLHEGSWAGSELLAVSPLPTWERTVPLDVARRGTVAAGIAATGGLDSADPATGPYVAGLRARIATLPPYPAGVLGGLLDRTLAARGNRLLPFGAWHGDFTVWNVAALAHTVLVWDWERYARGVPLGYDLLHHDLWQRLLAPGEDVPGLLHGLSATAGPRLAPLGLDADEAATVARLYLVEITTRYLEDKQDEIGALAELLPAVLDALSTLPTPTSPLEA